MAIDLTAQPYGDRFSRDKAHRTKVLFHPDRPLQAAELNEAQSIQDYYLERVGSAIMVDGDIQKGMDYRIEEGNVIIGDGEVFYGGKVRQFKEQSMPFNDEGTFHVCVALKERIVTSNEDTSLLDQSSGSPSYFSRGADRLEEELYLTADTNEGVSLYEFRDGELFITPTGDPQLSRLDSVLAERTFDESGSYRVNGLELRGEPHPTNTNALNIIIEAGRAYVRGFQITKSFPTRIEVPKARDSVSQSGEVFYYDSASRRGKLGNSPVSTVKRVLGQVRVVREVVTRGPQGDTADHLRNSSVISVAEVWQEDSGGSKTTFQVGRDYQLINGNQIDWGPAGNEPSTGTSYFVTYVYNKVMEEGKDYDVVTEGTIDNRSTYIDFGGKTGNKPVPGSIVTVDYDYYLARIDLVTMDQYGEIRVKKGQPASMETVQKPVNEDPFTLDLGTVLIYPDSTTMMPRQSTITRMTMMEMQNFANRLRNIEYNNAVNALDGPAMQEVNPATLRGVFSDGFINMSKYDSTHPDSNIGFSFEDAEITLPYASADKKKPRFLAGNSDAHVWGRLVSAPFTEEVGVSQLIATDTINVNPYEVFNNTGVLKLTPSEDNWIEEDSITVVEETEAETLQVRRWWGSHKNDPWVADELALIATINLDEGHDWQDSNDAINGSWTHRGAYTGTQILDGGQRTVESMIEFMRQIEVSFEAKNMRPNEDNLILIFDGQRVPITPASGFTKGTDYGSIRTNAQGVAKGRFRIPPNVETGIREVSLENKNNFATTTFVAQGTKKTTEDVILRRRVTIDMVDPLAQSFQFRENKVVTSVNLYFATKDNSIPVTVQIRGITPGGMPDKTIYAETVLTPSQVKTSDDASVPTKVAFEDPLVCEAGKEYAIVIIANSDQYTHWIATRGENNLATGSRVTSNPYLTGVLYSSSNASAWTIHQDSDLKFQVFTANFNPTATLEFDEIEDVAADAIVLMATYLTPENTGAWWEVKIIMENEPPNVTMASKKWEPLANYEEIELNQLARSVKLRAHFETNRNMSPLMSLNDILLTSFVSALSGSYVSRTIDASDAPYNTVNFSVELHQPGSSSITPQWSSDSGITWNNFKTEPEVTVSDGEFNRYKWSEKVTSDSNGLKSFKVRLNFNTQNSFVRPRARRLMSTFVYE